MFEVFKSWVAKDEVKMSEEFQRKLHESKKSMEDNVDAIISSKWKTVQSPSGQLKNIERT